MVLFIAEESAEFIEDAADDYKYTKLIWDFLENLFDKLGDWIEIVFKWLRMEVLLVFMQIEYFNNCYVSVMKTLVKTFKFWINFLKNHGFSWIINPIGRGFKRLGQAKDLEKVVEIKDQGDRLKQEISKISKKID